MKIFALALAACGAPVHGADGAHSRGAMVTWTVDGEPWLSPDGSRVALISSRHGGMNVYTLDLAHGDHGNAAVQLTTDGDDDTPSWSPDGAHIAYVSVRADVSQIWVMNADGSDQHAVTSDPHEHIHPAWTPDGRVLFDTSQFAAAMPSDARPYPIGDAADNAMDLATVAIDGRDLRPLTHGGGFTYASFSPDGRSIVHRHIVGPRSTIAIMNADGTGDHDISGAHAEDGWPSWSPDGERIAFARAARGTMQIFTMRRDGSDVVQITDEDGRFTNPRWSPDGKTILCARRLGDMTLMAFPARLAR